MKLNGKILFALLVSLAIYQTIYARAGGGGGHSHSSSHSSGGFSSGYGGHSYYTHSSGGSIGVISTVVIIIIVVVFLIVASKMKKNGVTFSQENSGGNSNFVASQPLPPDLDQNKVRTSFLGVQDAWQRKDLKSVRKWMSDGVYQRFNAQFAMMNKLSQVNKLSNIRIDSIALAKEDADNGYKTADVAISFTMDDEFTSDKYPQFNQKFRGESATEYWTFIKKEDAQSGKNLYDNNNCPNCGAPFDVNMGEISRCSACGTLTNNASYDWVLSEITQEDDYNGGANYSTVAAVHELTKNDKLFSVQRIEDVASNIFMQIMEVLSGAPDQKLSRFADETVTQGILQYKKQQGDFVFDRLYLNDVDLKSHTTEHDRLNLIFSLRATYQRVRMGQKLTLMDNDMVTANYTMKLSKNLKALQTPEKETVYSYECANCGAPFSDTTNDVCPYCSAPIVDFNKNWVLTGFGMV